jgi:hypothetical protein
LWHIAARRVALSYLVLPLLLQNEGPQPSPELWDFIARVIAPIVLLAAVTGAILLRLKRRRLMLLLTPLFPIALMIGALAWAYWRVTWNAMISFIAN